MKKRIKKKGRVQEARMDGDKEIAMDESWSGKEMVNK